MVFQGCTSNALSGSDISLRSAITDALPLEWPGLFLMMIESSVRKMQFFEIFLVFYADHGRKFSYSARVSLESIVFNPQLTICPLITSTGVETTVGRSVTARGAVEAADRTTVNQLTWLKDLAFLNSD